MSDDEREKNPNARENADATVTLKDQLIAPHEALWRTTAFADKTLDLFDKMTWNDVDYKPLLDAVQCWLLYIPFTSRKPRGTCK